MVFQSYALFPHLPVYDNIAYGLRARMRGEIRAVQRRLGITSLYVTHDQEAVPDGARLTVDLHNPGPDEFSPEGTPVTLQLPSEVPALLG